MPVLTSGFDNDGADPGINEAQIYWFFDPGVNGRPSVKGRSRQKVLI